MENEGHFYKKKMWNLYVKSECQIKYCSNIGWQFSFMHLLNGSVFTKNFPYAMPELCSICSDGQVVVEVRVEMSQLRRYCTMLSHGLSPDLSWIPLVSSRGNCESAQPGLELFLLYISILSIKRSLFGRNFRSEFWVEASQNTFESTPKKHIIKYIYI